MALCQLCRAICVINSSIFSCVMCPCKYYTASHFPFLRVHKSLHTCMHVTTINDTGSACGLRSPATSFNSAENTQFHPHAPQLLLRSHSSLIRPPESSCRVFLYKCHHLSPVSHVRFVCNIYIQPL